MLKTDNKNFIKTNELKVAQILHLMTKQIFSVSDYRTLMNIVVIFVSMVEFHVSVIINYEQKNSLPLIFFLYNSILSVERNFVE